jgi:uncharacterized protein
VVTSPPRRPRRLAASRRTGLRGSPWRTALAVGLLAAGIVAVVSLAILSRRHAPTAAKLDPRATVVEAAARYGCPAGRVSVEPPAGPNGTWFITVHAPRGFHADRFALDLEAAVHNAGGTLEPAPLSERGGYGLVHLDGALAGQRWRVLVLGEEPPPTPAPRRPQHPQARLAIVLDDAGNSEEPVAAIAGLPRAVAVAVLPNARRSREVARLLAAQGRELLVHMPMEPLPGSQSNPGPGAIEVGLPPDEIAARVRSALAVVAGARGLNNHMGSRATADAPTMRAALAVLRQERLYFLDSRTTPETVAQRTAQEMGVPALRRDVFLDVATDPDSIRHALRQVIALARTNGSAVAIGHVHPITIEVLRTELPALPGDVALVPPSALLRPAQGAESTSSTRVVTRQSGRNVAETEQYVERDSSTARSTLSRATPRPRTR